MIQDDITVDLASREVRANGLRVGLSPTEVNIFSFIVCHRGRGAAVLDMAEDLWGTKPPTRWQKNIHVHVNHINRKVAPLGLRVYSRGGCYLIQHDRIADEVLVGRLAHAIREAYRAV